MEKYKHIIQRLGLMEITNILLSLSSIIMVPLLTKNLSVVDYGIWVQLSITITLLSVFASMGLTSTLIRFLASQKDIKKIQEIFYSILIFVTFVLILIVAILFFFSSSIAEIFFGGYYEIAMILPFILFFACLNKVLISYFNAFQQMKLYSILMLLQSFLSLGLAILLIYQGFGLLGAVLGLLITYFVLFILMFHRILSHISFKVPKFEYLRSFLEFGLPLVPTSLSYWILASSDRYIIGIILGIASVGYYSPGYTLGYTITMLIYPFTAVLPAVLPKYYDNGKKNEMKIVMENSLKYFFLFAIPAAFGLSLLSKDILTILSTTEIASKGYQITFFTAFSGLVLGLKEISVQILMLKKKTKIIGVLWTSAAFLSIILNFILIPILGILGAGLTTLLTYSFISILSLMYSRKYFIFSINIRFIAKSIFASVLMSLFIHYFNVNANNLFEIAIVVLSSAFIYFIVMILLKGIDRKEFNIVKMMINTK